jgi:2-iminobutanoate/2-iminopropanoate deaminase
MFEIKTDKAPAAIGPYVQGVNLGNLVITSGQIPLDPKTKLMADDVGKQTTQALNNILAILLQANLQANDIVKTTVFLKDLNDFIVVNKAYEDFFKKHQSTFPARSCIEVARLPMDAKVEIEAIAFKK